VIDVRDPEAFSGGHIPQSINIWLKGLPVFGGWFVTESTRIYLVLRDMSELEQAVTHLARIGIDRVDAALLGGLEAWREAGLPLAYSGTIDPGQLEKQLASTTVLDVRDDSEFEDEGHIAGARHLYLGYLDQHLDKIKADLSSKPNIAVVCSVGHRAGVAASLLERHGFHDVKNLLGGMTAWGKLKLATTTDREHTTTTPEIEGERA
jgi:hydroxyacylglutathione hydrolase